MKPVVRNTLLGVAIFAVVVIILIGLGAFISSLAHDPVKGVVERVGSVANSEHVSIKLQYNSTLYTCDERCYAMREGDMVTLEFAPASSLEINRATIDQTMTGNEAE